MYTKEEMYQVFYTGGVDFGAEIDSLIHTRAYSAGKAVIRGVERETGEYKHYDTYILWLEYFLKGINPDMTDAEAEKILHEKTEKAILLAKMEEKCYNCDSCEEPLSQRDFKNCYQMVK